MSLRSFFRIEAMDKGTLANVNGGRWDAKNESQALKTLSSSVQSTRLLKTHCSDN